MPLVPLLCGSGGLLWWISRIYAVRRTARRDEHIARIEANRDITLALINTGCLTSGPSLGDAPASSRPRPLADTAQLGSASVPAS
jgi:hypothetical protein